MALDLHGEPRSIAVVLAALGVPAAAAVAFGVRRHRLKASASSARPASSGLHVLWAGLAPSLATDVDVSLGCTSERVSNEAHAIDALIRQRPDLVVIGPEIAGISAGGLMRKIRQMQSDALESPSLILGVDGHRRHGGMPRPDAGNDFDDWTDEPHLLEDVERWLAFLVRQRGDEGNGIRFDPAVSQSIPGYIESRIELACQVEQMLRDGNRPGAARAAHKLAGSPGILGFEKGAAFYRRIAELADDDAMPIDASILAFAQALAKDFSALHRR